jgi:glycosyltransferase involved in cell wall biosynthesis
MPGLYAAADICLVPLKARPVFRSFIPSKMFEIMACARPIVSNVDGEARAILERSRAALLVAPGDGAALARAVAELASDEQARRRMGHAGREFVLAHYDRDVLAARYAALLEQVVASRRSRVDPVLSVGAGGVDHSPLG